MHKSLVALLSVVLTASGALFADTPVGWTEQQPVYFTIKSNRDSKYATEKGGGLVGNSSVTERGKWYLIDRGDGSFDIRNGISDNYVDPSAANDTQLQVSSAKPAKGWSFKSSAASGYYIIVNGSSQFNQTRAALGFLVYNWGGGVNTTDDGCQFVLTQTSAPDKSAIEDVKIPAPVLTVTDRKFDGVAAYRADLDFPEEAARIFAAKATTTAVEYSMEANGKDFQALVGSSNVNSPNYFCYAVRPGGPAFRGVWRNGDDNWYTMNGGGTGSHKVVFVSDPAVGMWAFVDGTRIATYDLNKLGDYGVIGYGNIDEAPDALTIGGVVCPKSVNSGTLNYMTGTVKSVRFYDTALTDEQIEALEWSGLTANQSANVEPDPVTPTGPYGVNYPDGTILSSAKYNRATESVSLSTSRGRQNRSVSQGLDRLLYHSLMDEAPFVVKQGEAVTATFGHTSGAMNGYVYVDLDNDGQFDPATELVAKSQGSQVNPPAFTIPASLEPGVYRVRFKVDLGSDDPAGATAKGSSIVYNNGAIIDAPLMVMNSDFTVNLGYTGGTLVDVEGADLAGVRPAARALLFTAVPPSGQHLESVTVTYGFPSRESKWGNAQTFEAVIDGDLFRNSGTVEASCMLGAEVSLAAEYAGGDYVDPREKDGYKLVWNVEFNEPDGTPADMENHWQTPWVNPGAAWAKYIIEDNSLRNVQGGRLVLTAKEQDGRWTTGAVWSEDHFYFTYGYVEARVMCNWQLGTFPAFWMMPHDFTDPDWPECGEIDIWEAAKNPTSSHHTAHGVWSNYNGYGGWGNPQPIDYSVPHTFALEWTPTSLEWFVDGKSVHFIDKGNSKLIDRNTNKPSWPFDKPFFVILNQSVGNGGFAANPTGGTVYTTEFDYVRVYQKPGQSNFGGDQSSIVETECAAAPAATVVYDLHGRRVANPTRGLYIINGQKVFLR
ncbi:MAG: family 16 glycosylhydrolase [Muribaculaceae bacterium]|nr:family 16 glycosylhydrolase [Muribaculaceae bacterium]